MKNMTKKQKRDGADFAAVFSQAYNGNTRYSMEGVTPIHQHFKQRQAIDRLRAENTRLMHELHQAKQNTLTWLVKYWKLKTLGK